ncbi:MAG: hypothetical protein HRU22_17935 [Gammaproteobacteria bacterium]|nr:hypothetical protein [Gammaproteobacteria bacterium]
MELIFKLVIRLGILATIISILFIGWFIYMSRDMCGNYLHSTLDSPERDKKVVIYQRDCGATTGFTTQISLLRAGEKLENDSGNIFIISGHPDEVAPQVKWINSSSLRISRKLNGREYLAKTSYGWFDKVSIEYD